jgi:hypothetical protein
MSSNAFDKIDPVAASALQMARGEVSLRIETALRSDPQRTDWQLARELEVKRAAIARIRAALESQGEIPVRPSLLRVIRRGPAA